MALEVFTDIISSSHNLWKVTSISRWENRFREVRQGTQEGPECRCLMVRVCVCPKPYTALHPPGQVCRPIQSLLVSRNSVVCPAPSHPAVTLCLLPIRCDPGWEGLHCERCVRMPGCQHGTCHQPWQCICHSGWAGKFCDKGRGQEVSR